MADLPNNPNNREEEYLADIAGLPNDVPENPWNRKEAYLAAIGGRLDGIDAKIAALATDISLKGGVEDYDHLPTDAAIGDAYITEDTGILYVWVGDEWTPLNMQGGGGFTELTSNDYDYPTNNPTQIAAWKLPSGMYVVDDPMNTKVTFFASGSTSNGETPKTNDSSAGSRSKMFIVIQGYGECTIIFHNARVDVTDIYTVFSGGALHGALCARTIDSRNSTSTHFPLSANQGMILNKNAIGTTESKTIVATDWTALASSDPYDCSATVTLTATIGADSTVELINDQAVLFGTYGFAIGSVSGQNVTIYSIGQPDASVTLKINVKG